MRGGKSPPCSPISNVKASSWRPPWSPSSRPRLPDTVAEIIRVHSLMHAAEGVFYRDVVAAACRDLGLDVIRTVERDLAETAAMVLDLAPTTLAARLAGLATDPPWSEDYRIAALAAWLGLGGGDIGDNLGPEPGGQYGRRDRRQRFHRPRL